jgi:ribonuclease HI
MNLIQIQEDLKGMPIQALQAYMNGSNPEVPPFLAAGEMQRRQAMMQREEMRQGAEQGSMPSVKEQLEQTAGLMALQQERSQQAMQQMAQQGMGAPMPATEGTPQPEPQPSPEAGVAGLPVDMGMKSGGIVGYRDGGETGNVATDEDAARQAKEEAEKQLNRPLDPQAEQDRAFFMRIFNRIKRGNQLAGAAIADLGMMIPRSAASAYDMGIVRPMRAAGIDAAPLKPMLTPEGVDPSSMMPFYEKASRGLQPESPDTRPPQEPGLPSVVPRNDMAARRSATRAADVRQAPQIQMPPTPAPRPEPEMEEGLPAAMPEQTPIQRGIESERQIFEAAGLGGLADRRRRMEEQFAADESARRRDALIETLAGGVRGFGGTAAAGVEASRRERAERQAMERQMYGLEEGEGADRYAGIQGMTEDILRPGADRSTETERHMARVQELRSQGKNAEADAYIAALQALKYAPQREAMSPEKIVEMAMRSWDEIQKDPIKAAQTAKTRDEYVRDYVQSFNALASELRGQSRGPAGTSGTAGSGAQSNLNPKALADQIRAQLGR